MLHPTECDRVQKDDGRNQGDRDTSRCDRPTPAEQYSDSTDQPPAATKTNDWVTIQHTGASVPSPDRSPNGCVSAMIDVAIAHRKANVLMNAAPWFVSAEQSGLRKYINQ